MQELRRGRRNIHNVAPQVLGYEHLIAENVVVSSNNKCVEQMNGTLMAECSAICPIMKKAANMPDSMPGTTDLS